MKHWPQLEAQMLNSRCAYVLKDRRAAVGICGIDRLESSQAMGTVGVRKVFLDQYQ